MTLILSFVLFHCPMAGPTHAHNASDGKRRAPRWEIGRHLISFGRHSASKKSYVTGKIAGKYHAQGYSWEHAERIATSVTNRMTKAGVFESGKGSHKSYNCGYAIGHKESCPVCGARMVRRRGRTASSGDARDSPGAKAPEASSAQNTANDRAAAACEAAYMLETR